MPFSPRNGNVERRKPSRAQPPAGGSSAAHLSASFRTLPRPSNALRMPPSVRLTKVPLISTLVRLSCPKFPLWPIICDHLRSSVQVVGGRHRIYPLPVRVFRHPESSLHGNRQDHKELLAKIITISTSFRAFKKGSGPSQCDLRCRRESRRWSRKAMHTGKPHPQSRLRYLLTVQIIFPRS